MLSDFMSFLYTLIPDSLSQTTSVSDALTGSSHLLGSAQDLMGEVGSGYSFIISCIALVICLGGCFFGYKLSRILMVLISFLLGATIGGGIGYYLLDSGTIMILLPALIGGVICAIASRGIYNAGIFLLGFATAFFATATILNTSGELQFFLSTIIGLAVGILALRCIRPVIILSTAIFFGANLPGFASSVFEHMSAPSAVSFFEQGYAPFVFMILGILVQFLTTEDPVKKKEKQEKKKKESGAPVYGQADVNSKKSFASSFRDAFNKEDTDDYDTSSNNYDTNSNHSNADFHDSDMSSDDSFNDSDSSAFVDNSNRPIENAEYRQIR